AASDGEPGQEHAGGRWSYLGNPGQEGSGDRSPDTERVQTPTVSASVYPKEQRQAAPPGHFDDEGQGNADAPSARLGPRRRNRGRPTLVWIPEGAARGGRHPPVL